MYHLFNYLKMKKKSEIFLKVQIQCQNVRIKVFDSSLTKVNKPMNKHLVYKKKMGSQSLLD